MTLAVAAGCRPCRVDAALHGAMLGRHRHRNDLCGARHGRRGQITLAPSRSSRTTPKAGSRAIAPDGPRLSPAWHPAGRVLLSLLRPRLEIFHAISNLSDELVVRRASPRLAAGVKGARRKREMFRRLSGRQQSVLQHAWYQRVSREGTRAAGASRNCRPGRRRPRVGARAVAQARIVSADNRSVPLHTEAMGRRAIREGDAERTSRATA